MRSVMQKFLNSSELTASSSYWRDETLANEMRQFGLYQIVYYLYKDAALYTPLYGMVLLLNDIGARREEGVTENDHQLYDGLKKAIGSTIRDKGITVQQCVNVILSFLRRNHHKVKDNKYLKTEIETLEKWSFIADNVKKGSDKLGDSL